MSPLARYSVAAPRTQAEGQVPFERLGLHAEGIGRNPVLCLKARELDLELQGSVCPTLPLKPGQALACTSSSVSPKWCQLEYVDEAGREVEGSAAPGWCPDGSDRRNGTWKEWWLGLLGDGKALLVWVCMLRGERLGQARMQPACGVDWKWFLVHAEDLGKLLF